MYSYYSYGSGIAALAVFTYLIGLASAVCIIIGLWKLFVKAGKPGWHAVVPFLNIYTLFEVAWTKKHGIAVIVLEGAGFFFTIVGAIMMGTAIFSGWGFGLFNFADYADVFRYIDELPATFIVGAFLVMFAGIAMMVGGILVLVAFVKLGRSFGKQGGFLAGLFLVPAVFLMILAFGKNQYLGTPFRRATGPYVPPNYNNPNMYNQVPPNRNPYGGQQNPYGGQQNMYGRQNPYNQQNSYGQPNPYGQQNPYGGQQNPYGAQQNPNMYNQQPPQNICPNCGQRMAVGAKFCAGCGRPM